MLTANLWKNLWLETAQQNFKPSSYKYIKLEKAKEAISKLKTWKEQCEMIVHLFSTDPRPELLVTIMVPPDKGTPVFHHLLELNTLMSRAQTQLMSPDKLSMIRRYYMPTCINLTLTITGLPTNIDPQKDQSDDNLLKPVYTPSKTVKEMIPHFTEKHKDKIFENDKIKITDRAKFKFNNGYMSLDLTKVDFSKLRCPTRNYIAWRHEQVIREQVKAWLDDGVIAVNYESTPVNLALLAVDQFNSDGTLKKFSPTEDK
ncbi:hypothetical protein SARC_07824 [Sphaeroforma arctica JP610]|uniref:Uncharacterized protein n=1 Tax=Sphaeroforma arctica JP610 TaxID=667725 RepID=A0A0L0FSY9_9EUKA|nr:hypothetical protein SARC_07824 [Sphaeroforma arctica JP610]KNC79799.1 hypothetical protein SARC_07824 [Sphaeroforma arctica JP610]|eukprot:XP_014153701.1 hypothetical protein SARC_07824 [Sphaeroforma arctica JP610]